MEIKDYLIQLAKEKQESLGKKIDVEQIESINVTHGQGIDTVYFNMKKVGNKKTSIPVDITIEELLRSIIPGIFKMEDMLLKMESKTADSKQSVKKKDETLSLAKLIIDYILFLANKSKIQFCTSSTNLGIEILSWLDDDEDISILNDISKRHANKKLVAFLDNGIGNYNLVDISENLLKKGDIVIFKSNVVATDVDLNTYILEKTKTDVKYPISNDNLEEIKDSFINHETIYKFANDVVVVLFK